MGSQQERSLGLDCRELCSLAFTVVGGQLMDYIADFNIFIVFTSSTWCS